MHATVAPEIPVLIELHLVRREHIGRFRDPRDLDDLERHEPAVVRALERGDRLDGSLQQSLQLLASPIDGRLGVVRGRTLNPIRAPMLPGGRPLLLGLVVALVRVLGLLLRLRTRFGFAFSLGLVIVAAA